MQFVFNLSSCLQSDNITCIQLQVLHIHIYILSVLYQMRCLHVHALRIGTLILVEYLWYNCISPRSTQLYVADLIKSRLEILVCHLSHGPIMNCWSLVTYNWWVKATFMRRSRKASRPASVHMALISAPAMSSCWNSTACHNCTLIRLVIIPCAWQTLQDSHPQPKSSCQYKFWRSVKHNAISVWPAAEAIADITPSAWFWHLEVWTQSYGQYGLRKVHSSLYIFTIWGHKSLPGRSRAGSSASILLVARRTCVMCHYATPKEYHAHLDITAAVKTIKLIQKLKHRTLNLLLATRLWIVTARIQIVIVKQIAMSRAVTAWCQQHQSHQ